MIFDNTENKTSNVIFKELQVNKYSNDEFVEYNNEIHISKNKGDIYNLSENIISSASIDEILNNDICSLNGKDYNKKELICGEDYKLVKLGDICKFLPKSKR